MKKYILPSILVIFSIVIVYQCNTLRIMKEEIQELKQMNMSLEQNIVTSVSDINNNVQDTISEELAKSYLTKDISFKLNKNQEEGYDLTVCAELSQLQDYSKVLFMYKDEESNIWKEQEMNKIGELSYTTDFILPYYKSYEYKIVTKGDTIESGDVETLETNLFMPKTPEVSWGENEEGIYLTYYEESVDSGADDVKVDKIEALVSHDKEEKAYKCKYVEESMKSEDNDDVGIYIHYELDIPKKDYNGKLDYIRMKVTYDNGIIDYIDVTGNKIENEY